MVEDKAKEAYKWVKKPVIVEDTGLYIYALNKFPGALIKWLLKSIGNKGICKILNSFNNRSAYAKTVICYYDGKHTRFFIGRINGRIAKKPSKGDKFGWDPIFIPEGYNKTFAELGKDIKNKISMRSKAFKKFVRFLRDLNES